MNTSEAITLILLRLFRIISTQETRKYLNMKYGVIIEKKEK